MSDVHSVRMSNDLNDSHHLLLTPTYSRDDRQPEMYYITSNYDDEAWSQSVDQSHKQPEIHAELYHISTPESNMPILGHPSRLNIGTSDITTAHQYNEFQGSNSSILSQSRTTNKKRLTVSFNLAPEYNEYEYDVSSKTSDTPVELHDVSTSVGVMSYAQSKAMNSMQRSMVKYRF